jgi:uncharacterized protein
MLILRAALCLVFACIPVQLLAREYSVRDVPNPRTGGGFLSDPENLVKEAEKTQIDDLLIALERDTTAEFAVVILPSIGAAVPKDFAVELFNHWGIGKAGKNNGLLLLVVLDQRKWEFETGYGLEGVLPDAVLKRAGDQNIPVHFRAGNYGRGILAAVTAVEAVMRANAEEVSLTDEQRAAFEKIREAKMIEERKAEETFALRRMLRTFALLSALYLSLASGLWFWLRKKRPALALPLTSWTILALLPLVLFGLYLFRTSAHFHFIDLFGVVIFRAAGMSLLAGAYLYLNLVFYVFRMRRTNGLLARFASEKLSAYQQYLAWEADHRRSPFYIALVPAGLVYFIYANRKSNELRNQPRACEKCGAMRRKLDEVQDDVHLEKGQIVEEQIGSIDYDAWYCEACQDAVVFAYDRNSSYQKCPECKRKTYKQVRSETITAATYSSSGTGVHIFECKNCGLNKRTSYTIPKLVRSTSSSSSGYRSSSSGSYRSSSGSSSGSSGSSSRSSGSFGGGRSGGGGAGGSW